MDKEVGTFSWKVNKNGIDYGVTVNIIVHKQIDGKFIGKPDKWVQTPKMGDPYVSMEPCDSIGKALDDVVRGFELHMGNPAETVFSTFSPSQEQICNTPKNIISAVKVKIRDVFKKAGKINRTNIG